MTETLEWRRVDGDHFPPAYFNDSHRFAIFAEVGGHGWELCWQYEPDSGYDFMAWFATVADAKADALRRVRHDERRQAEVTK